VNYCRSGGGLEDSNDLMTEEEWVAWDRCNVTSFGLILFYGVLIRYFLVTLTEGANSPLPPSYVMSSLFIFPFERLILLSYRKLSPLI